MFETIVRLYKKTGNTEVVEKAAAKGWISQEEKTTILAGQSSGQEGDGNDYSKILQ